MKLSTKLLTLIGACLFAGVSQAAIIKATANLDGLQEAPSVATDATGKARITVRNNGNVNFTLRVKGIFIDQLLPIPGVGPVHLHEGAVGENGDIVLPFPNFDWYTPTNRGFKLQVKNLAAPANLADLIKDGMVYINVHTFANTSGEIRGQLMVPEPSTVALLGISGLLLLARRKRQPVA